MRVPAALAAIPLIAGCAAGLLCDGVTDSYASCAAGAAWVALVAALGAFGNDAAEDCALCVTLGCLCAGFSLGISERARVYHPPLLSWFERLENTGAAEPVLIEGLLREDATNTPFGVSVSLDVRRIGSETGGGRARSLGGVRLSIGGTKAPPSADRWRAGRRLRLIAILRRPAVYLDPGVPDDRRALARRGVILVGSVKSAALVEVVALGSLADEQAARIRASVRARLAAFVGRWNTKSAAVAAAILIGDRTGLTDEDVRRLQQAGTYHVIAISGGNIAIMAALLLGVLRVIRVPARASAMSTIAALLFYGRITGSAASIDRAITGATIYLAARIIDHRGSTLNVLAVAAICALAAAPVAVLDPGFLLSFGATLGILLGAGRFMPSSLSNGAGRSRAALRALVAVLAATIAAEVALGPVSAGLFSRVTFAGLLLNFAAVPLMALVQGGSLVTLALSFAWPAAGRAAGYVAHLAAAALIGSSHLMDVAPWLSRDVVPPVWWIVCLYYAAVLTALTRTRAARVARGAAAAAALLMIAAPAFVTRRVPAAPRSHLRVVFLDVGQGDATLIVLPGGRALLVDAGGLPAAIASDSSEPATSVFDVGERVVAPALRALGVGHLAALVATHGDPDHIGGARAIVRGFQPAAVWEGIPVPPHAGLRALTTAADAAGSTWRTVQAGDQERDGGVMMRVLHPAPPEWERQRVRNEDSIVIEIRFGRVAIVLPGDIGGEGERAILPLLAERALVVLKAPHHGSATSSTPGLLAALHPAVVVFSAGRGNRFGHPHPAVVARYSAIGARMFSTAVDGAVILDTDGSTVRMSGWTGRSLSLSAGAR